MKFYWQSHHIIRLISDSNNVLYKLYLHLPLQVKHSFTEISKNQQVNILDKIVARKIQEVAEAKTKVNVQQLEKQTYFSRETYCLKTFLQDTTKTGIIAEYKRKSPSKGIINDFSSVEEVTTGYTKAGASALSVLTDIDFFMGHPDDVLAARAVNNIPILRKEFIIDEYQIIEAKALGADIILLIAAILTPLQINQFAQLAKSLGLSTLLEVHDREELERSFSQHLDVIGVNNRNLKDFSVSVNTSLELAPLIPKEFLKISESAISDIATINLLKQAGFNGFLIGENFMKTQNPGKAMQEFVDLF